MCPVGFAELRLRSSGHWDRPKGILHSRNQEQLLLLLADEQAAISNTADRLQNTVKEQVRSFNYTGNLISYEKEVDIVILFMFC